MQFAAKFVRLRSRKKAGIRREAEILKKVRGKSPYILEFQEAYERGRNLIIITELYVGVWQWVWSRGVGVVMRGGCGCGHKGWCGYDHSVWVWSQHVGVVTRGGCVTGVVGVAVWEL